MCIEGTIAARDESTAFPLGPEIQARLTVSWKTFEKLSHICKRCTLSSLIHTDRCPQVIINTALVNSLDLDHRVVPWDTVRSRAVLVSILHQVTLHFALAESSHNSYLSFFLHEQNFWRIKFTLKKTRKLRQNTQ